MSRLFLLSAYFMFMATCAGLSGCGSPSGSGGAGTPVASPAQDQDHDHDHDHEEGHDHDHAATDDMAAKIEANMAKLSDEDRAIAIKQVNCPIAGDPLGGMGVPIKVDVDGQAVFICCEGCKEDLLADKEKYLAIINGTAKEEAKDSDG